GPLAPPLGALQGPARGLEGAAGLACLAAPHDRYAAEPVAPAGQAGGKATPAKSDRHAGGLPAAGPRAARRRAGARHGRLRGLAPRHLTRKGTPWAARLSRP